jgi:hypothetical protein
LPPLHVAPVLCEKSHASPHPPQLAVVVVDVSQPSRSGLVVVQSANPPMHPP